MSDDKSSNTGVNRKPGTFEKGDYRINRKGRPRDFDALRALAKQIAHEQATTAKGEPIVIGEHYATNIEMVLRTLMSDKKQAFKFVEYAFGKVPDELKQDGEVRIVVKREEKKP